MAEKKRVVVYIITFTILTLLTLLFFSTCSKPSSTTTIETGAPIIEFKESVRKGTPLYMGFIPQGNAVFMVKKWQPLADYLAKELQMPVETVFRSSYREIITALSKGELDLCLTGALMYVLTRDATDIRPLVRRKISGSSSYHSIIIVRKDSDLKTFNDLKGKSFAFADKESTTGYLLPIAMMRQKGINDPQTYFSKVIYAGNPDSVLLSVYTGNIDGAAIPSTRWQFENPNVKELKIIWKSEPTFLGPFSVRSGLDDGLAARLKKAFLKIGKSPDTLELSNHIQIEGFEEAFDSDYDSIRRAAKWVF